MGRDTSQPPFRGRGRRKLAVRDGARSAIGAEKEAWDLLGRGGGGGMKGPPRVEDRILLIGGLICAIVGWIMMIPWSQLGGGGGGAPSLPQFLTAFTLVTVAFPFGRGICLAMVGKLLGDSPQVLIPL